MCGKGLCAPGLLEEAAATSSGPAGSEVPGSLACAPGTAPEVTAGLREHGGHGWGKALGVVELGSRQPAGHESASLEGGVGHSELS